ncbi:DUF4652 domain-containing protein (plasmid) [Clostridium perfringens]
MKKKLLVGLIIGVAAIGFVVGGMYSRVNESSNKYDTEISKDVISTDNNEVEEVEKDSVESEDKVNVDEDKKTDSNNVEENLPEKSGDVETPPKESVKLKLEKSFKFKDSKVDKKPEFNTPWKSNSAKKEICIEGRGPEGIEEGPSTIFLKDGDNLTEIDIVQSEDKLAPMYVEWIDNENFLVTMVNKYGRVFTGGALYKVNINDMKPYIIYKGAENEEISEASKINDDTINIKIRKYKDDGTYVPVDKDIKIK